MYFFVIELDAHYLEARQILDPPEQGGVILKYDFLEWAMSKLLEHTSDKPGQIKMESPKKFVMYHYDGRIPSGKYQTV